MIIDAKSIIITLLVVAFALTWGLKFVRKFALQIAMENHEAVVAMDQEEETQRLKKERDADTAAAAAFAKVEPMLNKSAPKVVSATTTTTSDVKTSSTPTITPAPSGEEVV